MGLYAQLWKRGAGGSQDKADPEPISTWLKSSTLIRLQSRTLLFATREEIDGHLALHACHRLLNVVCKRFRALCLRLQERSEVDCPLTDSMERCLHQGIHLASQMQSLIAKHPSKAPYLWHQGQTSNFAFLFGSRIVNSAPSWHDSRT